MNFRDPQSRSNYYWKNEPLYITLFSNDGSNNNDIIIISEMKAAFREELKLLELVFKKYVPVGPLRLANKTDYIVNSMRSIHCSLKWSNVRL